MTESTNLLDTMNLTSSPSTPQKESYDKNASVPPMLPW